MMLPLRLVVALTVVAAWSVAVAGPASAHEGRHVGEYHFVVGFLHEPAIVEEPNGLDLRVTKGHHGAEEPVEGLAETLQAEVIFGGQVMSLKLSPVWGEPGAYKAEFIPTAEGAYTFRIFGTIEGTPIDERFTSGPETFSEVFSRSDLSFPKRVAPVSFVQETASDALDTAAQARLFGILGFVTGLLGLLAGASGLVVARRARQASAVAIRANPREAGSGQS
jgi:hypothetical protein